MATRLDRLLSLLDTGSTAAVRTTAARQLGSLAATRVQHSSSSSHARPSASAAPTDPLKPAKAAKDEDAQDRKVWHGTDGEWAQVVNLLAKVAPFLRSRSWETRTAAAQAVEEICRSVGVWDPSAGLLPPADGDGDVEMKDGLDTKRDASARDDDDAATFATLDIPEILAHAPLLLSSSGTEYRARHGPADKAAAQRDVAQKLGLGMGGVDVDMGIDVGKELEGDEAGRRSRESTVPSVKTEDPVGVDVEGDVTMRERSQTLPVGSGGRGGSDPSPEPATPADDEDLSHLSARERNALKRKRKLAGKSGGSLPAPSSSTSAPPAKKRIVEEPNGAEAKPLAASPPPMPPRPPGGEVVVVDPAAKAAANANASAKEDLSLAYVEGRWPFSSFVEYLEDLLFSPAWEHRHGAALGLLGVYKTQLPGLGGVALTDLASTSPSSALHELERRRERQLEARAVKLVEVLARDRFGDYVGDMVVAPVRETVAMALGCVVKAMRAGEEATGMGRTVEAFTELVYWTGAEEAPKSLTKAVCHGGAEKDGPRGYAWQARHAGLLGIKYFVAVKAGFLRDASSPSSSASALLKKVFDAAMLGLADPDDDVRSAAAAALLPVTDVIVESLGRDEVTRLVERLWGVLRAAEGEGGEGDLAGSVGGVMDLLAKLVTYPAVLESLASGSSGSEDALSSRIPLLLPYIRHPLVSVRLAVVRALHIFVSLPTHTVAPAWVDGDFVSLVWEVLFLELKPEVRKPAADVWSATVDLLARSGEAALMPDMTRKVDVWIELLTADRTVALDPSKFVTAKRRKGRGGHDVDKAAMGCDLALVSMDELIACRLAASDALAYLFFRFADSVDFMQHVSAIFVNMATADEQGHQDGPANATRSLFGPLVVEAWALKMRSSDRALVEARHPLFAQTSDRYLDLLVACPSPDTYAEVAGLQLRSSLQSAAMDLQAAFRDTAKLSPSRIRKALAKQVDWSFDFEDAKIWLEQGISTLVGQAGKSMTPKEKSKVLEVIEDRKRKLREVVTKNEAAKSGYDVQRVAALASALVAMGKLPAKVSPVIKALTESLKLEQSVDLQMRSAEALASFVDIATSSSSPLKSDPTPKIISNLAAFLCQDETQTPTWRTGRSTPRGILSAQEIGVSGVKTTVEPSPGDPEHDRMQAARLLRRGSGLALSALAARFGEKLVERIPKLWQCMSEPVTELFGSQDDDVSAKADARLESDETLAQQLLDCLTVVPVGAQNMPPSARDRLAGLCAILVNAAKSKFAIVRYAAARTFASLCATLTEQGMICVVDGIPPLVADPIHVHHRRGAIEVIARLVEKLDVKILAYVIFLIVPVLGRMSDADDDVRIVATHTFASLIKLVPLEAGVPNPPGFSQEMLERRLSEREFLGQLLGTSQIDEYIVPVEIKADLRKYQRQGISWLAFLAKYQLHGVLCDDMGLGKTLQTICILASKYHERATTHAKIKSPDSVHLPSLVVCPPTLTGHWSHEIITYTTGLRPLVYVGSPAERVSLLPKIKRHDIVIMSYDIVRNDIEKLAKIHWNYCVLDEGHVIKNAKSKLSKAVKQVHANHRLILSGTPIQNNALELWSLFDFLMPGFLGTERSFNERFGKPINASRDAKSSSKEQEAGALALEALHKQVLPFLLRRLKEDVLDDLPPKIIQDYYCDLSPLQKALYEEFAKSKAKSEAEGAVASKNGGEAGSQHIFQALQYLKKLVNHPMLIYQPENTRHANILAKSGASKAISDISHSPKLLALRQLLRDCGIGSSAATKAEDDAIDTSGGAQHRVLIFCQMKEMINIIERDLFQALMPSVAYMRLDGTTEATKRHAIVQKFNADPSIDVLLLTTSVGGLGLNLTGADTVIFVEHDWNPMKDLQAMDRAHRLGQKRVVNVYRLITRATLEEKIMGLQRFKLNIASSVVNQQNSSLGSLDPDQILDLFNVSAVDDAKAASEAKKGLDQPVSQKNVLEGLEDLPVESEYSGYDAQQFVSSL